MNARPERFTASIYFLCVGALLAASCGGASEPDATISNLTESAVTISGGSDANPLTDLADSDSGTPTTKNQETDVQTTIDTAPETEPIMPVSLTDSTGVEVTIESVERIVPVDGDLAEIIFALGLGHLVVATDISATYPPEAAILPDIGYQRALNAEPIAAVEPTLVLATDTAKPVETLDQLRDLQIPVIVIVQEPSLHSPAEKIQAVADALGVPNRGRELAAAVDAEIALALELAAEQTASPRTVVLYLRGERVQLMLGAANGVDVLLDAVGATDVAAELGIVDTRQITAEALLLAAPEVILVTTTGLESVGGIEGLLEIPGIAETPAGQLRQIFAYEDQYLLGGGPRTGQLMIELVETLSAIGLAQVNS